MRYQQCMTRSMTLIKIYFVNTMRVIGQEVFRKLAERVGPNHRHGLIKGTI